jgi:hypothetical protein
MSEITKQSLSELVKILKIKNYLQKKLQKHLLIDLKNQKSLMLILQKIIHLH